MAPLQKIKSGIQKGRWDWVCEGYSQLTGETVEQPSGGETDYYSVLLEVNQIIQSAIFEDESDEPLPSKPYREPVTIEQLEKSLQEEQRESELLEIAKKKIQEFVEREQVVEKQGSGNYEEVEDGLFVMNPRVENTAPRNEFENQFEDDESLASKADWEASVALSKNYNRRPPRSQFKKISLTCCKCKTSEDVHPDLKPINYDAEDSSNYVCNACIGR